MSYDHHDYAFNQDGSLVPTVDFDFGTIYASDPQEPGAEPIETSNVALLMRGLRRYLATVEDSRTQACRELRATLADHFLAGGVSSPAQLADQLRVTERRVRQAIAERDQIIRGI